MQADTYKQRLTSTWIWKSKEYIEFSLQVSSGALNMAKSNVDLVLKLCATPPTGADAENPKLAVAQQKAFHDVTRELVREVTSPNQTVREQVRKRNKY